MPDAIDAHQLQQVLESSGPALVLYASQWTRTAAEDCVQEAVIRLLQQPKAPDSMRAWLFRTVRNLAISESRTQKRRVRRERVAAEATALLANDPGRIDERIDAEQASLALQSLPLNLREIVIARVWGELTFEEIAQAIGISSSSAHRRFQEALTLLRQQWTHNEWMGHVARNERPCQIRAAVA